MPLSPEEEIEQIEDMVDLKQVHDKRTGRKGQMFRITAQV